MAPRSPFALGVFVGSALLPFFGGCGGGDVDRFRAKLGANDPGVIVGRKPLGPSVGGDAEAGTGGGTEAGAGGGTEAGAVTNSDARADVGGLGGQGGAGGSTVRDGGVGDGSPGSGGTGPYDARVIDGSSNSGGAGASTDGSSAGGAPSGSGGVEGRDASSRRDSGVDAASTGCEETGPVGFVATFDVDPANMDIAVDRASCDTYVSIGNQGSLLLAKVRPNGTIAWQKQFGGAASWFAPVAVDDGGNVIIASDFSDPTVLGLTLDGGVATGPGDFVAKYTSAGTLVFATMVPGGGAYVDSEAVTPDGRILVSARRGGSGDGFLASLTPNGTVEWKLGSPGANILSVASDPSGNAVVTGSVFDQVSFGGATHTATAPGLGDYFIARLSVSGVETDFRSYGDRNSDEEDIYGVTDRVGNLYLRGRYQDFRFSQFTTNTPLPVSFDDGPSLASGLPYFMSLTLSGKYRYGFSVPGFNSNAFNDLAVSSDGTAWYVGRQVGALAVGNLYTPDPGSGVDGAMLLRASSSGDVDLLRAYAGGWFSAVDVDGKGRPVVGGRFTSAVDFGAGVTSVASPTAIVARLNLPSGVGPSGSGGAGGAGDASVGSGGTGSGAGGGGSGDAAGAIKPVEFAVTFDTGSEVNIDIAADRVTGGTYVSLMGGLTRLRADGTIAWQKAFPSAGNLSAPLVTDADGNVIMASGYDDGALLGLPADAGVASGPGFLVAKYTADGSPIFVRTWPSGRVYAGSSGVTPDGRILVTGYLNPGSVDFGDGPIAGQGASFVLSLDAAGNHQWSRGSDNLFLRSVASDAQGGAVVIGEGVRDVSFGGVTHAMGNGYEYLIARFSPSGIETDFKDYGSGGSEFFGATDRAGNLYLRGNYLIGGGVGFPSETLSFNDSPALAYSFPFFITLNPAGNYHSGSSVVGYENWINDLALANDGTVWYAGSQRGALAIGRLLTPDPGNGGEGEGGLLFRASPAGVVETLRCYPGGHFVAVDADERGRPIVAGHFWGGVDFGAGVLPMGSPSTVVAKLNL